MHPCVPVRAAAGNEGEGGKAAKDEERRCPQEKTRAVFLSFSILSFLRIAEDDADNVTKARLQQVHTHTHR